METAKRAAFADATQVETFKEAVLTAYQKAQSGDAVLLSPACASWDMFDNFEQRGEVFKQIVKEIKDGRS